MTKEEAIDLLDNLDGMIEDSQNNDYDTAFKMAIKALKQESVLDKIRAKIEASRWTDKEKIERNALASGLDKALEIIDKYTGKSEVNNG